MTAYFQIPKGLRVSSCADGALNSHFSGSSTGDGFDFSVSLYEQPETYESNLAGIHDVHDDDVRLAPATSLTLHDGSKIVSYIYSSPYWGQELVVIIPHKKASTKFEFRNTKSKSKADLMRMHGKIERIIGSFRYLEP